MFIRRSPYEEVTFLKEWYGITPAWSETEGNRGRRLVEYNILEDDSVREVYYTVVDELEDALVLMADGDEKVFDERGNLKLNLMANGGSYLLCCPVEDPLYLQVSPERRIGAEERDEPTRSLTRPHRSAGR